MPSYLFILTFPLLVSFSEIDAIPAPKPDNQGRNLIQFGNMVGQTLGTFALNYNGYGCWCGFGGKGEPVDAIDACCKAHDQCYDDVINSRPNIFACSPYISFYSWSLDSKTHLPLCNDTPGSCARRVCECDRIVTECYKRNADTFDKSLKCPKQ